MMIDTKAAQNRADAHRQDLMTAAAGSRRALRRAAMEQTIDPRATQRSAAGPPVAGGRAVRRTLAPRVGAWLIDFGTRLGGASIRTS
jgi:hypothetical protein